MARNEKRNARPDWAREAAEQLDCFRSLYSLVHEALVSCRSLKDTMEQLDHRFGELFQKEYERVNSSLSDEEAVLNHILKKRAGLLRGEDFWKDP